MNRRLLWVILTVVALSTIGGMIGTTVANGGYILEMEETVETPEQTVEHEGESLDVSGLTVVELDEEFSITTEGPNTTDYGVYLRSLEGQGLKIIDRGAEGSGKYTVSTSGIDPGSYIVTIEDSTFEQAQPLLIPAYGVQVSSKDEFETLEDEKLEITAELSSHGETETIHSVEAVLWNDRNTERITLTAGGDDTYSTTIADLDAGTYDLYVGVLGDGKVGDTSEHELIGVSENYVVDVKDSDNEEDGDEDGEGNSKNGGQAGGGEEADDSPPTDESDDLNESDNSSDTESTDDHEGDESGSERSETDDTNGVIEPTEPGSEGGEAETGDDNPNNDQVGGDEIPGFGMWLSVLALIISIGMWKLRPKNRTL